MTIILGILLLIFVASASYSVYGHFSVPLLVSNLAGLTSLGAAAGPRAGREEVASGEWGVASGEWRVASGE
jgi:hypothetical protein